MQWFYCRVGRQPSSINNARFVHNGSDLPIPAPSEDNSFLDVHLADVDRVLELKYTLTDAHVFEGPLAKCAVIRAGEEAIYLLHCFEMVDLVSVTQERDRRWSFLTRLHCVHIPTTDQAITVAWEHQLRHLITKETECCDIVLNQELLLVLRCVQRVIWAEILQFAIWLFKVI